MYILCDSLRIPVLTTISVHFVSGHKPEIQRIMTESVSPPPTAQSAMADEWEDALKRLLRRGKVYTAAVLDPDGCTLASIPDLLIAPGEGEGLVKAATCNYACSFKLLFAGTCFTCFHKERNVLVGCAEETVLVGKKMQDVFIVGLARSDSPGSCLYEVTEFARSLRKSQRKSGSRKVIGSGV